MYISITVLTANTRNVYCLQLFTKCTSGHARALESRQSGHSESLGRYSRGLGLRLPLPRRFEPDRPDAGLSLVA